jgi:hypothetical protein
MPLDQLHAFGIGSAELVEYFSRVQVVACARRVSVQRFDACRELLVPANSLTATDRLRADEQRHRPTS